MVVRAGDAAVALETTLLAHGVPRERALALFDALEEDLRSVGATGALVGVVRGAPVVGMTRGELVEMLDLASCPKVNTANLGVVLHSGGWGATTVSTTMELAAEAGVRVFATGGIGGVHRGYGARWDVSADLAALARFPVAVVSAGVKSILDVEATREVLETLGVPVIGYGTDRFPAFYLRESPGGAGVDARFDDAGALGRFVGAELARTGRGMVIANPIPEADAIAPARWDAWVASAMREAGDAMGRDATPALLAALHRVSGGATIEANIALVRHNARVAGAVAVAMARG
jgi:pseudouridine-5'-phosphate glycosidase